MLHDVGNNRDCDVDVDHRNNTRNYDNMLSRFDRILERDGQTDGRMDKIAISISHISVLTRDKNCSKISHYRQQTEQALVHDNINCDICV